MSAEFNPENLPVTKVGICSHDDHESWTGDKPIKQELRLMMWYSDEYNTRFDSLDHTKLTDDEYEKQYEELEKIKWESGSEQYWCEDCMECLE